MTGVQTCALPISQTPPVPSVIAPAVTQLQTNEDWLLVFDRLDLQGWAATQIRNLCLLERKEHTLYFLAPAQALAFINDDLKASLKSQLQGLFKENLVLSFEARDPIPLDNVSTRRETLRKQLLTTTLESLQQHPHIQLLQQVFQASFDESSIVPAAWMPENTLH